MKPGRRPRSPIERVRRAIIAAHRSDPPDYSRMAKAAIAAMREPSDAMLTVGRQGPAPHEYFYDRDALLSWRDMIDVALSTPE